ncbi:MAG: aldolase [Planctomycetaceae bacterium]|nr:aldolase [Planctomycetaceae bacterium]
MTSESAIRDAMAQLGLSLFARGYAVGGAGNLSARLPDGSILVTPTNSSLGRLDPARLSKLALSGEVISGDQPSKEAPFHLALYRADDGIGAVCHLHSTHLTALSCLNGLDAEDVLRPFTPYYVMRVGQLPLLPYRKPGSPAIASDLTARLALSPDVKAFLLANHGSVVLGRDIYDAVNNAEELEETAKLYFILGDRSVRHLTPGEVEALRPRAAAEA